MKHLSNSIDQLFRRVNEVFETLTDSLYPQIEKLAKFQEACTPVKYDIKGQRDVCIESRGYGHWAVTHSGSVLNKEGEWEWEPMPSGRNDEFIRRTRWNSPQGAFEAFKMWLYRQKVK